MLMGARDFFAFILRGGRTFSRHQAQQRWLLRLFVITSFPVVAGLSIFHMVLGFHFLALTQGICALSLPVIYRLLQRSHRLPPLEVLCIGIVSILLFTVIIDGGVDHTALYWLPVFPFLAFFILGLRRGWYWVTGFALVFTAIIALMQQGVLPRPYGPFELNISLVIYLFYTALAALFEALREIRQDDMEQKNAKLAELSKKLDEARQGLEVKIASRTASLQESNRELRHEIEEHEQAKQALEESERRFLQAQKMEALGTLVGGIAHDFNNMLSGINANLFLIKRRCGDNPETAKHIDNISTLSAHAAEMIRQLLTFARKDAVEYRRFNASPFFNEALKLGRVSIPPEIRFIPDIERETAWINGNATQLQQVLFNLISNARDAVEGGKDPWIRVEMKQIETDAKLQKKHHELTEPRYLRLTVSDNGGGIEPENLNKVFEPFFTTKQAGKGTGLGLAMCYGAAQRHGGMIDIESEPGQGTQIYFYLPLAAPSPEEQMEKVPEITLPLADSPITILIVDDDDSIRASQRSVLEELGFQVVEAVHGKQAVEQFHAQKGEIKLILMDIKMPVMDGFTAADKIRELQPDVPFVFLSGNYDEYRDAVNQLPYEAMLLEKPVTIEKLSETIRRGLLTQKETGA